MFCDQVSVTLIAGRGGDGCVSFRREKYISHGGPDGGNGGKGGSIVLKVNPNLNSLIDLKKRKIYKAESGTPGHRYDKAGKHGNDYILDVPPGTLLYEEESDELIADLVEPGSEYVVLEGGKGGFGNAHFATSVRQAPDFAEKGEPGSEMHIRLEMQMVADVGIIGLPSVGKSTLISRITKAKPKIAEYHFTTLIPNMGVVDMAEWGGDAAQSFVVADIPGLIEGAHEGKGLGHEFLRHISRTAILVHVLDCQNKDMIKDYEVIMNELEQYDPELVQHPQVLAINKVDTIDDETQGLLLEELEAHFKERKRKVGQIFMISAVAGGGLKEFMFHLFKEVQKLHKSESKKTQSKTSDEGYRVFRPHLDVETGGFDLEKVGDEFIVKGRRIEQIVVMTDMTNRSAIMRVHDVMEKMGILKRIRNQAGELGDIIRVGEEEFEFRG
jgi:GTP-binding protein